MRKLLIPVFAALVAAAPLVPQTALAHDHHHGWSRDDGDDDDDWDDDDDNRGGYEYRDSGWDSDRYNGYYYGDDWYYGAPPPSYYDDDGYRPGYRPWRRGGYMPSSYRAHCQRVDWRAHHLRAPPRGYGWMRDDRGDYLLVGLATGLILGVILDR